MSVRRALLGFALAIGVALAGTNFPLAAGEHHTPGSPPSAKSSATVADLSDRARSPDWTTRLVNLLTLRDYNTRIVLAGTALLGVAGGVVGTFMLLRKRALVGDVVSHAALPGIAIAFLLAEALAPGEGRRLEVLLLGALVAGLVGVGCVLLIRRFTRLKEDAALAIVLSVFFGLGISLFTIVQDMPSGNVAGLQGFIYGKAAALTALDVKVISICALAALVLAAALFKELSLLCFDEGYAAAQGWSVVGLDLLLMGLVAFVTVIGIESVGLLLVVAMLIVPAAAARFWTDHLPAMTLLAALLGGASGLLGAGVSALAPRLAAGPVIVLAAAVLFGISMFFSPHRGVLARVRERRRLTRRIKRQHLLRTCYELLESGGESITADEATVSLAALEADRDWSRQQLQREIAKAQRDGLFRRTSTDCICVTPRGLDEARRVARNHRLWELYLIEHADVAPARVDRYADLIEHVLEPEVVALLEQQLAGHDPHLQEVPASPHKIASTAATP